MFIYAHLGECWITYILVNKFHISFQVIPGLCKASGAANLAGHVARMLSSNLCRRCRSVEDREDGSVFLCPFPRGIMSSATWQHNCMSKRTPDVPRRTYPHGEGLQQHRGLPPFLTSVAKQAPAVLQARQQVPSPLPDRPSSPRLLPSGGGQAMGERQGHGGAVAGGQGGPGPLGKEGVRAPAVPPRGVAEEGSPGRGET